MKMKMMMRTKYVKQEKKTIGQQEENWGFRKKLLDTSIEDAFIILC
jgi:hypothetical protein